MRKTVPALLIAVLIAVTTGACQRPGTRPPPPEPALSWLPADCEWVVLWNGPAWQKGPLRPLLDGIRAWRPWRAVWKPAHDGLLGTLSGAAFTATESDAPTLSFLGQVDDQRIAPSAAGSSCLHAHPELARALPARHAGTLMRFAAELAPSLRHELAQGSVPFAAAMASILRVAGGLSWNDGVRVTLRFELLNRLDAGLLAAGLSDYRQEAKQHPDLLLLGLGPHLEKMVIAARGTNVEVGLEMTLEDALALVEAIGRRLSGQKRP